MSIRRPQAVGKPLTMSLVRFETTRRPIDNIDVKHEEQVGQTVMRAHPDRVSADSTMHPVFGEVGKEEEEKDTDMMAGIRSDLVNMGP